MKHVFERIYGGKIMLESLFVYKASRYSFVGIWKLFFDNS